jgi:GNAT superfamily N-acetyltransferase
MSTTRPARSSDAAELARLAGELGYTVNASTMAERLAAMSDSPRLRAWVIEGEGRLAGWITAERRLSLESGERIEITGLVVDHAARRAGLGRVLVATAEAWAVDQGLGAVVVRSNVQRETSHPFYEALGYVCQKSQHVYQRKLTG